MNSNFCENSISQYTIKEAKGKGAYGSVYRAYDKKNNEDVAIKKCVFNLEEQGFPSTALRQISILREINHPNVVKLKDLVIEQKQIHLIFEYLELDLKAYIDQNALDSKTVCYFMYQLLSGIQDCHMKRIIHRDLKPANILLTGDQLKIADFGLARTYSIPVRPYSEQVVTLWYRAPEILLGAPDYNCAIDIWALGCIFLEMLLRRPFFVGESGHDQMFKIFRTLGTPTEEVWPGVTRFKRYKTSFPSWPLKQIQQVIPDLNLDKLGYDLLNRMLTYDPSVRITAKVALAHPYFEQFHQKMIPQ